MKMMAMTAVLMYLGLTVGHWLPVLVRFL